MVEANVSETRSRVVQVLLALLIFTALWVALQLIDHLIYYPHVIEWLEKQEWWLFISPDFRELILRQTWQMLVALIITLKVFSRIHSPATIIAERYLPQFPPFLDRSLSSRDWLDFPASQLTLVGRNEEISKLQDFLDQDSQFSWWWLNGKGGSGKSRLVLEWMRSLPKSIIPRSSNGYDTGFLRAPLDKNEWGNWRWRPRRPTVIVIDEAAEYAEATLSLLRILGQQASELAYSVRVLLVERTIPVELGKLLEKSQFSKYRYALDPLTVSPLGSLSIQQLAQELGKKRGKTVNLTHRDADQVCQLGQGLPLFLILALDNLIQYGDLRIENRDDLVRKEVHRTLAKFRQHGLREEYWPALALATLTHGLPWQEAEKFLEGTQCPEKALLDRLFQQDTVKAIPPLQPDILGEYFLLEEFGSFTEPQRQRLLSTAWEFSPRSVASMFYKTAVDFPEHPQLAALSLAPDQPEVAVWWGRAHVDLLGAVTLPVEKIELYVEDLQRLGEIHHTSAEIQVVVAQGLGMANYGYRSRQLWDQSLDSFHRLIHFAQRNRENIDIQIVVAQTACSVLEYYGEGQHRHELEDALKVQADLSQIESLQQNPDFQLTMAVTAASSMRAQKWQGSEGSFQYLNDIAKQFPKHREIQLLVARAAIEVLNKCFNDLLDYDPFFSTRRDIDLKKLRTLETSALETLKGVANRDIGDEGKIHLKVATCVTEHLSLPWFYWKTMQISMDILEAVAIRNPEDVNVQIEFAKGAVAVLHSCVHFDKQLDKAIEMKAIVQKLKEVIPERFQNHEDISKLFLAGEALLGRLES